MSVSRAAFPRRGRQAASRRRLTGINAEHLQALKCNTNKCPTGITTSDPNLMNGLDVGLKSVRVYNYHKKTVESALEIMGAIGATR